MKRLQAIKKHARRRAMIRAGVNLSPKVLAELVRQIRHGESRPIPTTTHNKHTKTVHEVTFPDGEKRQVVYHKDFGTIVTVLPETTRSG